jgi:hypothetical protein
MLLGDHDNTPGEGSIELASMVRLQTLQSFVARIWLERAAGEDPKWRGHIQHIQGKEEVYFQDLREVCEFLEQVSGIPGPGFSAHPSKDVAISKHCTVARRKRKSGK